MYIDGKVHLHATEEAEYRWQCLCSDRLFVSYLCACHNGMYKLNNTSKILRCVIPVVLVQITKESLCITQAV